MFVLIDDRIKMNFDLLKGLSNSKYSRLRFNGVNTTHKLQEISFEFQWNFHILDSELHSISDGENYIVFRSGIHVIDWTKMVFFLKNVSKLKKNSIFLDKDQIVGAYFNQHVDLMSFLNSNLDNVYTQASNIETINLDFLIEIYSIDSLRSALTGNLESRQFNNIIAASNQIIKRSSHHPKMISEYNFYSLLPDHLQIYFLRPFDFKSDIEFSQYSLEKINYPDLSFFWINNLIKDTSFENLIDEIFEFIRVRPTRLSVKLFSADKAKILTRYNDFITKKENEDIVNLINNHQEKSFKSLLDDLLGYLESNVNLFREESISHGDLCLSNIFYIERLAMLKFIDPRGANDYDELFLPSTYDLIKLSHSILGGYDFIVKGEYEIVLNKSMELNVITPRFNRKLEEIFIRKLIDHGFELRDIRLYEASLFWSMLPLHDLDKRKTFALYLRGLEIYNEYR